MSVTVPTQNKNYPLYQQIVTLKAAITANTNPAHVAQWRQQLPALQMQLVDALMESGQVPASAILNTMSFGAADANTIY